jgi:hypothetical protein
MEPNNGGKVPQESPESRHNRHHDTIDQHRFDRQLESPLNKVDDYCSTSSCKVCEKVKDRVEDRAELNSLILEDTECVTGCSEDIVQDKVGDEVDNCLFEVDDILESMPDLSISSVYVSKSILLDSLGSSHPHARVVGDFLPWPSSIVDKVRDHRGNTHPAQHGNDDLVPFSQLGIVLLSNVESDPNGDTKESEDTERSKYVD